MYATHVTSRLARLFVRIGKPRELQISVTNDDSTGKSSYVLYTELSVQLRIQLPRSILYNCRRYLVWPEPGLAYIVYDPAQSP